MAATKKKLTGDESLAKRSWRELDAIQNSRNVDPSALTSVSEHPVNTEQPRLTKCRFFPPNLKGGRQREEERENISSRYSKRQISIFPFFVSIGQ